MRISAIATALAAMATAVKAISPISIYGSKFFDDNGNQFFMKGIAYQLTPDDPLVDTNQCTLDASLMKTLGVNCIRVYHVDPTADHSGCMAAFAAAGIYTVIDLDTFNSYILPNNPWWNETMLNAYGKVMDSFIKYDNLMGFFIGNEVIAINNQSQAAPFIKAAVRDVKAYGKAKGYRDVPIGYSAADIAELRPMLQDYLTCGGNSSENIDFFGLNSYEWCDPATFQTSGYQNLQNMAVGYPVPIFFSETGCNKPGPRTFGDQDAIFSSPMVDTWSGAIIYEWIEEANDYGIISYGPPANPTATGNDVYDGFTRKGTPTPKSPDFTNLKNKWATISPTGVAKSNYNPTASISVRECPAATPGGWLVNGNVQLPTLGATYTGTFQSSPSATMPPGSTSTGTAASPSTTSKGGASGNKQLIGMSGGLVAVMLIFTLWL